MVVGDAVVGRADEVRSLDFLVDGEVALGVGLGLVDQLDAVLAEFVEADGGAGLGLAGGAVDDGAGDGGEGGGGEDEERKGGQGLRARGGVVCSHLVTFMGLPHSPQNFRGLSNFAPQESQTKASWLGAAHVSERVAGPIR